MGLFNFKAKKAQPETNVVPTFVTMEQVEELLAKSVSPVTPVTPVTGLTDKQIINLNSYEERLGCKGFTSRVLTEKMSYEKGLETLLEETIVMAENLEKDFVSFNEPAGSSIEAVAPVEKKKPKTIKEALELVMEEKKVSATAALEVVKAEYKDLFNNPHARKQA